MKQTRKRRILIVDDSEMNRAMLANMLDRDFEIIEAADGREAITALEMYEGEIAALLLDVVMPEMDGFTLTRKIKTDPVLKDIPVVIHSSLSGNANEDHIRKVKADGYVAKFELNELSSVIEEVLDRSMKKIEGPLISRKQLA